MIITSVPETYCNANTNQYHTTLPKTLHECVTETLLFECVFFLYLNLLVQRIKGDFISGASHF